MKFLLMLEDDLERTERFRAILARHHASAIMHVVRTALEFIAAFRALNEAPSLICLDHDLFKDAPDDPDPGDGRDASNFLIAQKAKVPVLIHSSNSAAADSMLYSLRDAGWTVNRISPLGDDWIESYWYSVASEMVARGSDL